MTLTSIIHPGMLGELEAQGHFPYTGTVQEFTTAMVEGDAVETWVNLAGHIDLDCTISALTAREIEKLDKTISDSTHKALFTDYYPDITSAMQFVSGSLTLEITGVAHDQHGTMTRLTLKLIML